MEIKLTKFSLARKNNKIKQASPILIKIIKLMINGMNFACSNALREKEECKICDICESDGHFACYFIIN